MTRSIAYDTAQPDMGGADTWPAELLPASDARHCALVSRYDLATASARARAEEALFYDPPRANNGDDAGIIALSPMAQTPACWPSDVPRDTVPEPNVAFPRGFMVATCAPTNANEVRRTREVEHGVKGAVCSRSHQTFMNTTRRCTGTFHPRARQSCDGTGYDLV